MVRLLVLETDDDDDDDDLKQNWKESKHKTTHRSGRQSVAPFAFLMIKVFGV